MLRLAAKDVFRRREKLDPSVTGMANDIFSPDEALWSTLHLYILKYLLSIYSMPGTTAWDISGPGLMVTEI